MTVASAPGRSSFRPPPPSPHDLGAVPSLGGPGFRLVLPRDKRDRLAERTATLGHRRRCNLAGCQAEGMPVLLVDSELEAVLCPVHLLVLLDGSPVEGQPMLATAAW